jgi:hypothetical protein
VVIMKYLRANLLIGLGEGWLLLFGHINDSSRLVNRATGGKDACHYYRRNWADRPSTGRQPD